MSQNGPYSGPPWSSGNSDEPYAEPADPWGDHGAPVQEPAWGAHPPSIPQQPVAYHSAPLNAPVSPDGDWMRTPPPPPPKRNTPIIALVVTLGVLICIGLGATAWLLKERNDKKANQAAPNPSASATQPGGPAPRGSEDARFYVKEGDCVVNEGSDAQPDMRTSACTSGTFEVLKQVKGKTSGEKDAEKKCSSVTGYTKWYFYDSAFDDLDFVLCLKEHKGS
ncbi:LppU/SCO3897 family protein [Actinoplanes sp. CA-131856]